MKGFGKTEIKMIAARVTVVLLFASMVFSAFFICLESDHDCTGEDCPICLCMEQCVNTMCTEGCDTGVDTAAAVPAACFTLFIPYLVCFIRETPVTRKDRLDM